MASPVTPAIARALVPQASQDKCLALNRAILQTPLRFYQFINWLLNSAGNFSDAARAQVWPVGSIILSAVATAPTGRWLECNGALVSRSTYSDLFAAIGTTYGAGDGSTTFAVPDLRGRAPIGTGQLVNADASTGDSYTFGQKVGNEKVELEMAHLPAEPAPLGDKVEGLIMKRTASVSDDGPDSNYAGGGGNNDVRRRWNQHTDHADNVMGDLGDGEAHPNVTPALVLKYWIAY